MNAPRLASDVDASLDFVLRRVRRARRVHRKPVSLSAVRRLLAEDVLARVHLGIRLRLVDPSRGGELLEVERVRVRDAGVQPARRVQRRSLEARQAVRAVVELRLGERARNPAAPRSGYARVRAVVAHLFAIHLVDNLVLVRTSHLAEVVDRVRAVGVVRHLAVETLRSRRLHLKVVAAPRGAQVAKHVDSLHLDRSWNAGGGLEHLVVVDRVRLVEQERARHVRGSGVHVRRRAVQQRVAVTLGIGGREHGDAIVALDRQRRRGDVDAIPVISNVAARDGQIRGVRVQVQRSDDADEVVVSARLAHVSALVEALDRDVEALARDALIERRSADRGERAVRSVLAAWRECPHLVQALLRANRNSRVGEHRLERERLVEHRRRATLDERELHLHVVESRRLAASHLQHLCLGEVTRGIEGERGDHANEVLRRSSRIGSRAKHDRVRAAGKVAHVLSNHRLVVGRAIKHVQRGESIHEELDALAVVHHGDVRPLVNRDAGTHLSLECLHVLVLGRRALRAVREHGQVEATVEDAKLHHVAAGVALRRDRAHSHDVVRLHPRGHRELLRIRAEVLVRDRNVGGRVGNLPQQVQVRRTRAVGVHELDRVPASSDEVDGALLVTHGARVHRSVDDCRAIDRKLHAIVGDDVELVLARHGRINVSAERHLEVVVSRKVRGWRASCGEGEEVGSRHAHLISNHAHVGRPIRGRLREILEGHRQAVGSRRRSDDARDGHRGALSKLDAKRLVVRVQRHDLVIGEHARVHNQVVNRSVKARSNLAGNDRAHVRRVRHRIALHAVHVHRLDGVAVHGVHDVLVGSHREASVSRGTDARHLAGGLEGALGVVDHDPSRDGVLRRRARRHRDRGRSVKRKGIARQAVAARSRLGTLHDARLALSGNVGRHAVVERVRCAHTVRVQVGKQELLRERGRSVASESSVHGNNLVSLAGRRRVADENNLVLRVHLHVRRRATEGRGRTRGDEVHTLNLDVALTHQRSAGRLVRLRAARLVRGGRSRRAEDDGWPPRRTVVLVLRVNKQVTVVRQLVRQPRARHGGGQRRIRLSSRVLHHSLVVLVEAVVRNELLVEALARAAERSHHRRLDLVRRQHAAVHANFVELAVEELLGHQVVVEIHAEHERSLLRDIRAANGGKLRHLHAVQEQLAEVALGNGDVHVVPHARAHLELRARILEHVNVLDAVVVVVERSLGTLAHPLQHAKIHLARLRGVIHGSERHDRLRAELRARPHPRAHGVLVAAADKILDIVRGDKVLLHPAVAASHAHAEPLLARSWAGIAEHLILRRDAARFLSEASLLDNVLREVRHLALVTAARLVDAVRGELAAVAGNLRRRAVAVGRLGCHALVRLSVIGKVHRVDAVSGIAAQHQVRVLVCGGADVVLVLQHVAAEHDSALLVHERLLTLRKSHRVDLQNAHCAGEVAGLSLARHHGGKEVQHNIVLVRREGCASTRVAEGVLHANGVFLRHIHRCVRTLGKHRRREVEALHRHVVLAVERHVLASIRRGHRFVRRRRRPRRRGVLVVREGAHGHSPLGAHLREGNVRLKRHGIRGRAPFVNHLGVRGLVRVVVLNEIRRILARLELEVRDGLLQSL